MKREIKDILQYVDCNIDNIYPQFEDMKVVIYENRMKEIIYNLLDMETDVDEIGNYTGVSIDEIRAIKEEYQRGIPFSQLRNNEYDFMVNENRLLLGDIDFKTKALVLRRMRSAKSYMRVKAVGRRKGE